MHMLLLSSRLIRSLPSSGMGWTAAVVDIMPPYRRVESVQPLCRRYEVLALRRSDSCAIQRQSLHGRSFSRVTLDVQCLGLEIDLYNTGRFDSTCFHR